jgi:hypothetical protein
MSGNLPEHIEWVDAEIVDESETALDKPVCWWRCGPCPRHPDKTAGQWGIQVRVDEYETSHDGQGVLYMRDEQTKYTVRVDAEQWRVRTDGEDRLVHIDLLAFMPPRLPQAVDWQRITYWNDKTHPGDDQDAWRFDFDGPEAFL